MAGWAILQYVAKHNAVTVVTIKSYQSSMKHSFDLETLPRTSVLIKCRYLTYAIVSIQCLTLSQLVAVNFLIANLPAKPATVLHDLVNLLLCHCRTIHVFTWWWQTLMQIAFAMAEL